ncbi:MAG: DUF6470 family protein [Oscillospiraceae bacterium]|nr:DUF6470 family protein [Oscillospiraceae bacterium]
MKPMLEIHTVPISIEYKVTPARTERVSSKADVEMIRNKGGLTMKSRQVKVNIDTFDARNSVSKTPAKSIAENAEIGKQNAMKAAARFAEEGKSLLLSLHKGGDPIVEFAALRFDNPKEFNIAFIPEYPPDIDWIPPDLTIQYDMDKLNFDLKLDAGYFEFIPGNIEITIKEYPQVVIEYVGDPIYVHAAANPAIEATI